MPIPLPLLTFRFPALLPAARPPALPDVVPLDFGGVPEAHAAEGVDVGFVRGAGEDGAGCWVDEAEVGEGGGGGKVVGRGWFGGGI